ncbi:MAG: hypothetical protein JXR76_30845 [Deltaproteobacteria bacterium]|nr:hypothetical protein [Deltaproteobacteria bacterium]
MTTNDNNTKDATKNPERNWMEKNGPLIYGVAVFVALAAIGLLHNLVTV